MRQTTLADFLEEFEGFLASTLAEDSPEITEQPEERPITTMSKQDAIVLSIYDVILNTLQGKAAINKDNAETMMILSNVAANIKVQ